VQNNKQDADPSQLIEAINTLKTAHADLESKYAHLQFEYNELRRLVFRSKSERFVSSAAPQQLDLLTEGLSESDEKQLQTVERKSQNPETITGKNKAKSKSYIRQI
jgi:hypothetical protein